MKNNVPSSRLDSRLVVALGISLGLAIGIGGARASAVATGEPVVREPAALVVEEMPQASADPGPSSFQVVFQCFAATGSPVGLPKSTLPACRAACPAGGTCVRCVFQNNAVECD